MSKTHGGKGSNAGYIRRVSDERNDLGWELIKSTTTPERKAEIKKRIAEIDKELLEK